MRQYINILLTWWCPFLVFSSYYSFALFHQRSSSKALAQFTYYTRNAIWQASAWSLVRCSLCNVQPSKACLTLSVSKPQPQTSLPMCVWKQPITATIHLPINVHDINAFPNCWLVSIWLFMNFNRPEYPSNLSTQGVLL